MGHGANTPSLSASSSLLSKKLEEKYRSKISGIQNKLKRLFRFRNGTITNIKSLFSHLTHDMVIESRMEPEQFFSQYCYLLEHVGEYQEHFDRVISKDNILPSISTLPTTLDSPVNLESILLKHSSQYIRNLCVWKMFDEAEFILRCLLSLENNHSFLPKLLPLCVMVSEGIQHYKRFPDNDELKMSVDKRIQELSEGNDKELAALQQRTADSLRALFK